MGPKRSQKNEEDKGPAKKKKVDDKKASGSSVEPIVIKCKTIFKKKLVERAIARKEEIDTPSSSDSDMDEHSKYPILYSMETGNLMVGTMVVVVDETDKSLRCPQCTYVTKIKYTNDSPKHTLQRMEFGIRNHMIGQHLGGFRCQKCKPVKVFLQSYSSLQKHLMDAHDETRKKIDAKLKAVLTMAQAEEGSNDGSNPGPSTPKEDPAGSEIDSDEEDAWMFGPKKLKRPYKCSVATCGKRFHKVTRWQNHELKVHGNTVHPPPGLTTSR